MLRLSINLNITLVEMVKRKLEAEYIQDKVGKTGGTGKRAHFDPEAWPNEIQVAYDFHNVFEKKMVPAYFEPGTQGYIKLHLTMDQLLKPRNLPPSCSPECQSSTPQ